MVTFDLKAGTVALIFALIFAVAGGGIRMIFSALYMDADEPAWVRIFWVLVPAGLVGGWVLGWWLATP